jgi:hypothetical protein
MRPRTEIRCIEHAPNAFQVTSDPLHVPPTSELGRWISNKCFINCSAAVPRRDLNIRFVVWLQEKFIIKFNGAG